MGFNIVFLLIICIVFYIRHFSKGSVSQQLNKFLKPVKYMFL